MNGRQLADAARERRPDLKVLFMTGYVENKILMNGFLGPDMEVIAKPFAGDALATKMERMIRGWAAGTHVPPSAARLCVFKPSRWLNAAAHVLQLRVHQHDRRLRKHENIRLPHSA